MRLFHYLFYFNDFVCIGFFSFMAQFLTVWNVSDLFKQYTPTAVGVLSSRWFIVHIQLF